MGTCRRKDIRLLLPFNEDESMTLGAQILIDFSDLLYTICRLISDDEVVGGTGVHWSIGDTHEII